MITDAFGRHLKYLRLSVTDLCDMRCRYCMPAQGVKKLDHTEILSLEQLFTIAKVCRGLGVSKIRVTGGEPLVRRNVSELFARLKDLGLGKLALTTNGQQLYGSVPMLKAAGVHAVNVSIDTLDKDKYAYMTRGGELEAVIKGIARAAEAGFELKINAVYMKDFNDRELESFLHFARIYGATFRYIELMPFPSRMEFYREYHKSTDSIFEDYPETVCENIQDGTASAYSLGGMRFGVIAPLSHAFCGSCDRLRVTSRGELLTCLHSSDKTDLRPYLDDECALKTEILRAAASKPESHMLGCGRMQEKNMNDIGG